LTLLEIYEEFNFVDFESRQLPAFQIHGVIANMWRLLNQPLPTTPHLSSGGFAIFLAVFSLLPGLSNFVLAFAALLWFLCGMVHWLMGYRNLLLDRASKTSAFGLSEPTITLHP